MTQVKFREWDCTLQKSRYDNDRLALSLVDEEGPVATCTVNMPDVPLGRNEVCIKDYSENEGMAAALEAAGVIKPTGRTVRFGFVEIPVCELQGPFRETTHSGDVSQTRNRPRNR
jgi:hypothetical protein